MTRWCRLRIAANLTCIALLLALYGFGQSSAQPATVRGTIRDSQGKPVEHASVTLQANESRENFQGKTDAQGNYTISTVPDGVYELRASKNGFADSVIPSVFLQQGKSKTIDLTITVQPTGQSSASSAPQLFDQPQFSVAGITDATNLGGHGSDTVVRARDSLAKDTLSLGESAPKTPVDTERERSLREAAERKPSDFQANHELGRLLIATGRAREAIPFLERASTSDPANYENAYDLVLANAECGNYAAAREQGTRLLASHDQADLHHLLGDVNEKLGDSLEAVRHYQRAAELDPSEAYLFDWGAELLLHHAPEPAAEVFSKGTEKYPHSVRMLLGLGAATFARGNIDDAIRWICQASDLNPEDVPPYLFLGRIEQSEVTPPRDLVDRLHRFLGLHPQNADASYYYAVGLWKLRKIDVAGPVEFLLKRALEIDLKYAAAELQLGIVKTDQGTYVEAITHYQKALQIDPQMQEAHYRLAQAYRQIGESDKAKEELRIYGQLTKESAQKQDRERREIKQFVYTLRDQPATQVH